MSRFKTFEDPEPNGRFFLFLTLSAGVFAISLLFPISQMTPIFIGGAASLLALALIGAGFRVWDVLTSLFGHGRSAKILHAEPLPAILTSRTGRCLGGNAALDAFDGLGQGRHLVQVLEAVSATPRKVVRRLSHLALRDGYASEAVGVTRKIAVSSQKVAPGRLLWTFEPLGDLSVDDAEASALAEVESVELEDNSLLEALPVPILKIEADGTLLEANSQARAILAIADDQMPALFELVEGMGRPIADWLADAANGRGLLKPEFVRAILPGRELFLQISLGRVVEQGRPVLIGILNDATELKTLEAQFVQSQKMQAIGQLAGGVAHDFNNLLTAISGHCDLLLLRHDKGDPEYADLIQISQNSNRAASLVGQLLAFSRKQNLTPQALNIRDTMSELAHLLNRLIGEKITLEVTHEPGAQLIRADRRQLEQVIVNLVVNARDAMADGGMICVASDAVTLDDPLVRDRATVPAGDYVRIRVVDEGSGISSDGISKIFEPFYTTKKTGEGTGLGLSTAYGIVKQTGGYIFVDSKLEHGTTFTLLFPVTDDVVAATDADTKPAAEAPANGDGIVLLVEDEAPVRAFAARALRLRGYTVLEAECAEDALEIASDRELHIDIIVSDVIMPGLGGPTWVKQALETRADTRVIFVSGYSEEARTEQQARIPNSVFLPKPFSLKQLTTTVHQQLN